MIRAQAPPFMYVDSPRGIMPAHGEARGAGDRDPQAHHRGAARPRFRRHALADRVSLRENLQQRVARAGRGGRDADAIPLAPTAASSRR